MKVPRALAGTVTGEIVVGRPVREVFECYRDFANLPRFLGDVVGVEQVSDTSYRWIVAGPLGVRLPVPIAIVEDRADQLLRYRTRGSAPLRAEWRLDFAAEDAGRSTLVRESLTMPLGGAGHTALALLGKFPGREVRANLTRFKQLLEREAGTGGERGER